MREEPAYWRIGALTTWTELVEAPLPAWFDAVKLAAREVGGVQIQNTGDGRGQSLQRFAGGGWRAAPARARRGSRAAVGARRRGRLPLGEFVLGNRRTACAPDELVTAVLVPKWRRAGRGRRFVKLGARRYLVISIAMVAASAELDADGAIARAAASRSARARGRAAPAGARGATSSAPRSRRGIGAVVTPAHLASLAPIDDVRGDARRTAAMRRRRSIARALERLADE